MKEGLKLLMASPPPPQFPLLIKHLKAGFQNPS